MPSDSRAGGPTALLGSAKIDLRHLRVDSPVDLRTGRLGEDKKNIARLIGRFKQTKCRPQDPKNRVPILIERSKLDDLLRLNKLELTDLQRLPLPFLKEIPPNSGLLCLHGYHRLEAGRRHLGPGEDWWGVNIFSKEGTSEALEAQLRRSDNSAKPYDDGTVFYHARICERDGDRRLAREWLAELTPSKQRDYRQLQRQPILRDLRKAWDNLLDIPGIWNVLELGTFHRMLPMRCPEEQTHYVDTILSQFTTIFADNPEQIAHFDTLSASILQGRSPCFSLEDTAHVQKASRDNELFANLSVAKRSKALLRVRQHDRMFLTILTFMEDLKWLEAGSKPMAGLLPPTFKGTIRQGFYRYFRYDSLAPQTRQIGEDDYVKLSHKTREAAFSDAYRILFLFSLREFPYMSDLKPRQTKRDPDLKLDKKRNRTECWIRFAKLAQRVGFFTPTIERLSGEDFNSAVAADALKCAKPSSYYHAADLVQDQTENLAGVLREVQPVKISKAAPELTADSFQTWQLSRRCGRPFDQAFQWIERYGYLENVYTEIVPDQKQTITHFAVFRDTFHAFFGRSLDITLHPLKDEDMELSDPPTPSVAEHAAISDFFPESWVSTGDSDVQMQDVGTRATGTTTTDQSQQGAAQSEAEVRFKAIKDSAALAVATASAQRALAERTAVEKHVRAQAEVDARVKAIEDNAAVAVATASAQKVQAEKTAAEKQIRAQAEADARVKAIQDSAAVNVKEAQATAIASAQRAQAERAASEQQIKDQASAELAAANARIKEISDDKATAIAALEKANAQFKQLSDQIATHSAQKAQTDGIVEATKPFTSSDNDWNISPAPQTHLTVKQTAQAPRRSRTPLVPGARQQMISSSPGVTDKRRRSDSPGWEGRPRITQPNFEVLRGDLKGTIVQIRMGKATLPSILSNYRLYHSGDKRKHAKCLIKCQPDEEAEFPDLFFFGEGVQSKSEYYELVTQLREQHPPYAFFDIIQDSVGTKFKTSSNNWDSRMIIAKPVAGKSYVRHPKDEYDVQHSKGVYNVSLWPQWSQSEGFIFSGIQQKRRPAEPLAEATQLLLTDKPSEESTEQLRLTDKPSEESTEQLLLTDKPPEESTKGRRRQKIRKLKRLQTTNPSRNAGDHANPAHDVDMSRISKEDTHDVDMSEISEENTHDVDMSEISEEDTHDGNMSGISEEDKHDGNTSGISEEDKHDGNTSGISEEDKRKGKGWLDMLGIR